MAGAVTDLLVIGGGPAGLATAIRARLAGLSVKLLDRSQPPIDKACGEGLMPDAAARLGELGVELAPGQCRRFRGIRYLDGETVAEGFFPRAGGCGVRRLHLHEALARRAAEVGVELCWGVTAHGLAPAEAKTPEAPGAMARVTAPAPAAEAGLATGTDRTRLSRRQLAGGAFTDRAGREIVAARWVIGADGLRSQVRRWAGLEGPPARHRRFGVRRHFACRPWSDMVEVHWGPRCEAYVTPVGPEEVGVAMLWSERAELGEQPRRGERQVERGTRRPEDSGDDWPAAAEQGGVRPDLGREPAGARFDSLLAHFPALAARLAGAPAASRDRGAGPLRQRTRAAWRGNVALVGDAAGYVDAVTGEGLAVALHQSAALIEALRAGDLARYGAAHRRIGRLPDTMTALLLAIERRPWLRRRMVRALAAEPALFSRLLGIHARALPPARLGIDGALRLVYRLVTA
ncbi:MAG: NAD(P)/FAD-dependent oxidoreductase [Acidobacteria bacterium]|nr:NAD(P)/FAD-dependent oxidoreductase [Acidobacteriota bacterium]